MITVFQNVENLCKREIGIVITQFPVTITTNCQALTRCMNVSYVVGHHQAPSLLLYCVAEIRFSVPFLMDDVLVTVIRKVERLPKKL
jgi:hypothetical protein